MSTGTGPADSQWAVSQNGAGEETATAGVGKKYEKSSLKPDQSKVILQQLTTAMADEKLYLDPDLTLPQLSSRLNIPVHRLSQVLNEQLHQNFYRYINGYRIEDAKRKLCESDKGRNDKMIALAFSVGFQSLSTFNRVFKDLCGISPSAYRKTHDHQLQS